MGEASSNFIAGARVAVISGYRSETVREDFVERVYKNGRFLLRGDAAIGYTKQWTPSRDGDRARPSGEAGRSYGRESLEIWNEATDERLSALAATAKRRDRLGTIRYRVDRLTVEDITDAALDAIEVALDSARNEVNP